MKKEGQVSLFVIVALVIIGTIIIVQFFWDRQQTISKITDPIHSHVENCIEEIGIDGIIYTSSKGGYYISPEKSLESGIPIYLDENSDFTQSKKIIEEQLSWYVEDNLHDCLAYENYPEFVIEEEAITAKTSLNNEKIIFTLDYPIRITKGEFTEIVDLFSQEINVRMGLAHQVAQSIVSNELEDRYLCVDCLDYFSETYDFSINALQYDNSTYIISLIDKELNDKPYVFTFALDYD